MRAHFFLAIIALSAAGCQSRQVMCGGGVADRNPRVTLGPVVEVRGSPAHGYPVSHFPLPWYPYEMVRAGIAGEVVVRAWVDADGLVREARIVKSTQREFEAATLNAVERWRFFEFLEPGVKERRGMVVDCRLIFDFDES